MMKQTQLRRIRLLLATFLLPAAMAAAPLPPIDAAPFNAPVRVACIGDSITQGAGEMAKAAFTALTGKTAEVAIP